MSDERQVRPATEGWQQKKDAAGRPVLEFEAKPRVKQPPVHLVDMSKDEALA
ncbi:MAG: 23S rRNA (adenine(2503)-C(2))-methyltransferase RlmN, partial [Actinobacteria bacterium]|nr:23S rRNA (adenine(2503)-C(2))-methyltransferase RlmN [Actinomycetota bacterium]